ERVRPVEIRGHLARIAPYLAIEGALPAVHHANHCPIALAEPQLFTDLRIRISLLHGFAHHHFAFSRSEPSAFHNLQMTHINPPLRKAAQSHVHPVRILRTSQVDDGYDFKRCHRLSVRAFGDARRRFDDLKTLLRHDTG